MRTEKDFLGEKQLDDDITYGLQTARAVENFGAVGGIVHPEMTDAVLIVKKAAAMAYRKLSMSAYPDEKAYMEEKLPSERIWNAVIEVCDELRAKGEEDYRKHFLTAALQGGAGTSTNMNVNEVIANLTLKKLGLAFGQYEIVHPLDTINKGQSTNDVYPTALRIAAIKHLRILSDACARLQESLQKKETEFSTVKKLGRTEMMDAMPITLGEEFGAYAQAVGRDRWRLYKVEERLRQVNMGGTAVGTGANANRKYTWQVMEYLRELTDIGLAQAEYPMDITQNQDVFVEVSGLLKSLAVNLMKIASDFRLMNSGPRGGLMEIELPKLQKGSTIMPGKVNPVLPEMITQTCIRVIAHDNEITMAASLGNFELNAFLPLIADALLDSMELLTESCDRFREKCVDGICANKERCEQLLQQSDVEITYDVPQSGYDAAEKKRLDTVS